LDKQLLSNFYGTGKPPWEVWKDANGGSEKRMAARSNERIPLNETVNLDSPMQRRVDEYGGQFGRTEERPTDPDLMVRKSQGDAVDLGADAIRFLLQMLPRVLA
jgi:hypothetical protein